MLLPLVKAASELGVCVNKLKGFINSGALPVVHLGERTKRIDEVDLKQFIEYRKSCQSSKEEKSTTPSFRSTVSPTINRPSALEKMKQKTMKKPSEKPLNQKAATQ